MRSVCLMILVLACGCTEQEPIRTVKVPDSAAEPLKDQEANVPHRILGAIFVDGDAVWVFKLTGREADVNSVEPAFDEFLKSIRFPNGFSNSPVWTLPAGWREGKGHAMRFATLQLGDGPLEISVMRTLGGLQSNVERWAEQVGSKAKAEETTRKFTAEGTPDGYRVDLRGPKNPAGSMPMMAPGR